MEGLSGARKCGMNGRRDFDLAPGLLNVVDGGAQRSGRCEVEGEGDWREESLVVDGERGVRRLIVGKGAEGNELAGFRRNVYRLERFGRLLGGRSDLHHDVVLIQAFINVGDLSLAKGVAKRVVDGLNGNAKTRGRIAIDD